MSYTERVVPGQLVQRKDNIYVSSGSFFANSSKYTVPEWILNMPIVNNSTNLKSYSRVLDMK